jgi:hypothetical protein
MNQFVGQAQTGVGVIVSCELRGTIANVERKRMFSSQRAHSMIGQVLKETLGSETIAAVPGFTAG